MGGKELANFIVEAQHAAPDAEWLCGVAVGYLGLFVPTKTRVYYCLG